MRILAIEDHPAIGSAIKEQLIADGHAVDWVKSLEDAKLHQATADYQLILLDLMLPDGFGISYLQALRREGRDTPVIIMTALDQVSQRIEGLNSGADDYLVKPVDLFELSARVNSVLRRYNGNPNPRLQFGNIEIDVAAKSAWLSGKQVKLTSAQFTILQVLSSQPKSVFSKPQLESALYSFDGDFASNTVEAHISRIRKKLGAASIITVHGHGYQMGTS